MNLWTIFLGGILSFFSPCILPVLPLYFGYLSGGETANKKKMLGNTFFFVLGISFAFVALALGFSALGMLVYSYKGIFSKFSGILVILLGLFQMGIFKSRLLSSEKRMDLKWKTMTPFLAFVLGFSFSFAWTPCIGPMLAGVLALVSNSETMKEGILLMLVYTLGFTLPFFVAGYFLEEIKRIRWISQYLPKIMGVLLIALGILIYTENLYYLI